MANDAAPQPPPPSPPRLGYCLIQAASLSIFMGLCWTAGRYQKIFDELGMTKLPAPTELMLAVANVVRSSAGAVAVPAVGVLFIVLALMGKLDPVLRTLIMLNIVWAALMIPFGYLSLHLPIAQIEEALRNK